MNTELKDLARFFGDEDGDQLNMQFAFLLNQNLWLSLAREEAEPLEAVIRTLPDPPPDNGWATFLRNHDELSLDKLTQAQREEIFKAFGPDEGMQLYGHGLRRRTAAMLGGDGPRLRMAWSLMLSLPGTPVIFMGDEIGMGENLDIPDRMSVRVPMQWTGDRRRASPARSRMSSCGRSPTAALRSPPRERGRPAPRSRLAAQLDGAADPAPARDARVRLGIERADRDALARAVRPPLRMAGLDGGGRAQPLRDAARAPRWSWAGGRRPTTCSRSGSTGWTRREARGRARWLWLPMVTGALRLRFLFCALLLVSAMAPAGAAARDPGRWLVTGVSDIPVVYWQGLTSDPQGNRVFFTGVREGLWRTGPRLAPKAGLGAAIPADVQAREGYNHIGDPSWNRAEGGRVLLPLECYSSEQGNTCGTGAFGVADPATLTMRYYVKLDPAEIQKAMWAETSPDGELIWTSSGRDLLAYRTADVTRANAAPLAASIRAVRRLRGAVPPSGVTGAVFRHGCLFLAGQDDAAIRSGRSTCAAAPAASSSSARSAGKPRASTR